MSASKFFHPSNKRNPCPVCGDSTGKCRDNGNVNLCMPLGDTRAGEIIGQYKCIANKGSGWATFKIDNTAEWTEEKRREWEAQRRHREQEKAREEEERLRRSLSAVERDRGYRALLSQLNLHPQDRADLLRRGFTGQEIEAHSFKSVEANQQLASPLSPALPGVKPDGWHLAVSGAGYLCPIINESGLVTGLQIRLREPVDGNRYRWLSSSAAVLPLPNGENPVGLFFPPSERTEGVALVEGVGAKPRLAARLLSHVVIGAAGGQFLSSPQQLLCYLEVATATTDCTQIDIYPDAGDVQNRQVIWRLKKLNNLLNQHGYNVSFAWWGQVTKDHNDIDEGVDPNKIEYLRWEQFAALAAQNCPQSRQNCHRSQLEAKLENVVRERASTQSKPEIKVDLKTEDAPNQEQNSNPSERETEQQKEGETLSSAQKNWIKKRKFTPDIVVNQKDFSFPEDIPRSKAIIAVNSGLGTNKTGAMIQEIKKGEKEGIGAIIEGYRNNLLLQTGERANKEGVVLYHIHDDSEGKLMVKSASEHILLCADSHHHIDGYCEGKDIWLDESCSVLLHIVNGGTLKDQQAKVIKMFTRALEVANRVFMLDGNLSDLYVDFVAKLAPNKRVIKIKNKYQILPHTLSFVEGVDVNGELKKRDKSPLIKEILNPETVPFIVSDSKEFTNILDEILKQSGKKGYVLNRDTAGEEWAKEFLKDPDAFIQRWKPEYFNISPTAESGVSIITTRTNTINGHFTHKFSFFTGVLGVNSLHQMMFRLRDNIPHYIFCPERSFVKDRSCPRDYLVNAYKEKLRNINYEQVMMAAESSGKPIIEMIYMQAVNRSDPKWDDFACELACLDNFEMDNLAECLKFALEEAGHKVETLQRETDENTRNLEKAAKEKVQLDRATNLYSAAKFDTVEEAKKIAKSNPRIDVQLKIEKTLLLDRLPGIEHAEVWGIEFLLNCYVKDREFISKQQRFWLLNNFEVSQKRHEVDWYYKVTKDEFHWAGVRKSSHMKDWALQQLNVMQFSAGEWHKDSPEVIDFVAKAREPKITTALGIEPGEETVDGRERIPFVKECLKSIGLSFEKKPKQRVMEDGIRRRIYKLDQAKFNDPARLAVLTCVGQKYTQWVNSEKSQVNWEVKTLETSSTAVSETSSTASEPTELEVLIGKLEKCINRDEYYQITENVSQETLQDALIFIPFKERSQLVRWAEEISLMREDIEQCVEWIRDTISAKDPEFAQDIHLILSLTTKSYAEKAKLYADAFRKGVWQRLRDCERETWKALLGWGKKIVESCQPEPEWGDGYA